MAGDEEINYAPDHMDEVAKKARKDWRNDTTLTLGRIKDADASTSMFGEIPELAGYGTVFAQVKEIYTKAMEGVQTDFDTVADGIQTSARHARDKDDETEAAIIALWDKWDRGPLESDRQREQAESTPAAQAAAATADQAEQTQGAAPDAETPEDSGDNTDTRDEGEVTTDTGRLPEANPPQ